MNEHTEKNNIDQTNLRDELKEVFDEFLNLEKIHFENAKNYSYGYLIGYRHSDTVIKETKKEEAFYHAGLAEGYKRCMYSINKIIENYDKINQNQNQS